MYSAFSSLDFKLLKHLETTVGISCCASSCPNAIIENALILGLAWDNSFEKSYSTLNASNSLLFFPSRTGKSLRLKSAVFTYFQFRV